MNKKTKHILELKLKNIGPEMAKKLDKAGITTPEKLKKIGAKKAFIKIYESGGFCGKYNAAYLYALEGAIRGCDWRSIPKKSKIEFKQYAKKLREEQK